jgi:hypothetical protein
MSSRHVNRAEKNASNEFRAGEEEFMAGTNAMAELDRLGSLTEITRQVVTDDAYQTARDLNNIMLTNQLYRRVVSNDPELKHTSSSFQEACSIASDLSESLAPDIADADPEDIATHGPVLTALSPSRRSELAHRALAFTKNSDKAIAVSGLWAGAKHLLAKERAELVSATIEGIKGVFDAHSRPVRPNDLSVIVGSALEGAKFLPVQTRSDLVNAIVGLDAVTQAEIISGYEIVDDTTRFRYGPIGNALTYLQFEERSAIVKMIRAMPDPRHRALAIGGMASGFEHLHPDEVNDLVRMIWHPMHDNALGKEAFWAMRELGPGLMSLSELHISKLGDLVREPLHPHYPGSANLRAMAVGGLGALVQYVGADKFIRMITDAGHPCYFRSGLDVSVILAGWGGAGLEHFRSDQRSNFVAMITQPHHPQALKDEDDIGFALCGIGRGLEYLKPKERSALVQATLNLGKGPYRGFAIGGMGRGMGYLKPEERRRVVAAAKQLSHEMCDEEFGSERSSERSIAMGGLMRGIQSWVTDIVAHKNVAV